MYFRKDSMYGIFCKDRRYGVILYIFMSLVGIGFMGKLGKIVDLWCIEGMPHYGMVGGYKVLILKI